MPLGILREFLLGRCQIKRVALVTISTTVQETVKKIPKLILETSIYMQAAFFPIFLDFSSPHNQVRLLGWLCTFSWQKS